MTISHVLEHLPDLASVRKAIECAEKIASDFLFIQGPYFDADKYLETVGLKFFWSDWRGHPCHLTTEDLRSILLDLGLTKFNMMVRLEVKDSDDSAVHPWNSPPDQHEYNADIHPKKPSIRFPVPIYKEMVCYVKLRPIKNWEKIIEGRKGTIYKKL